MKTLQTNNSTFGFYGTIRHHADPEQAWELAMRMLVEATRFTPEAVRDFLDSRRGRHFADDVANGLSSGAALDKAIADAIDLWTGWRTGRRRAREDGTPVGTPYLVAEIAPFESVDGGYGCAA